MFAFCPTINHDKCGVQGSTGTSTDMGLKAGLSKLHVQSTDMRYKKPAPGDSSREYDACYYEVTLDQAVLETHNPTQLHVQISTKKDMNVYIYGGKSRMTATESIIAGNAQASAGATYSIGVDKGFLVVAYPTEGGAIGEFGFNYWIEADLKPAESDDEDLATPIDPNEAEEKVVIGTPDNNNEGTEQTNTVVQQQSLESEDGYALNPSNVQVEYSTESGDMLFYILCGGAGVLAIAIVILCIKCRSKGKITTQGSQDVAFGGNNSNERSLHLEDMDEEAEDYKGHNDTNRPSLPKQSPYASDSTKLPNVKISGKDDN